MGKGTPRSWYGHLPRRLPQRKARQLRYSRLRSSLLQLTPGVGQLLLEAAVLLEQLGAAGPGLLSLFDGLVNLVGVLVGSLAALAGLVGLLGYLAVLAEQDGGGVADPGEQGSALSSPFLSR